MVNSLSEIKSREIILKKDGSKNQSWFFLLSVGVYETLRIAGFVPIRRYEHQCEAERLN
jgi:hypothetical protein